MGDLEWLVDLDLCEVGGGEGERTVGAAGGDLGDEGLLLVLGDEGLLLVLSLRLVGQGGQLDGHRDRVVGNVAEAAAGLSVAVLRHSLRRPPTVHRSDPQTIDSP